LCVYGQAGGVFVDVWGGWGEEDGRDIGGLA